MGPRVWDEKQRLAEPRVDTAPCSEIVVISTTHAGERTRTSKGFPPPAPKAGVSTNSTTPAWRARA